MRSIEINSLVLVTAMLIGAHQMLAQVHYVSPTGSDSHTGLASSCADTANAWQTVGHAASLVNPGDTVLVCDGTYPENVAITRGGTDDTHRVTFRSQNKWGARIQGQSGTNVNTISAAANYVTIQDFEITGTPSTAYGIKEQAPAAHINVIGNNIHDIGVNNSACIQGAAIGAYSYTTIDANQIWNVSSPRTASVHCNYQHGIYVLGGTNGTITNNKIFDIWQGVGIQFGGSDVSYWVAANNTVFNVHAATNYNFAGGATYMGCTGGKCDYNHIVNNIFANNNGLVYQEENNADGGNGTCGPNNIYDHNVNYNSGTYYFPRGYTPTNEVTTDPKFINYTGDQSGDYHVQSASPAIDAGRTADAPNHDFDRNKRPQGSGYDIGAYESVAGGAVSAPTGLTATIQ